MTTPGSSAQAGKCPSCGAEASGRYCSSCGAPLGSTSCTSCGTALSPGSRFCHNCGAPSVAGVLRPAAAPVKRDVALPWTFAAIALVALVAVFAAQRFGASSPDPGAPLQQTMLGDGQVSRARDISQMSPRERAVSLYNRVMTLAEERARDSLDFAAAGKEDSLQFFAQMAIQAHLMIDPRDADVRYDLGRIAEVAGAPELARAQADSILSAQPNHLLGLMLATSSARRMGDSAAAREFERRFVAAAPAEEKRSLPEYDAHRGEITSALQAARSGSAPQTR